MIPKIVKYGRSIEVGGPFGRRPVERVWFGWDVELEEGESEPEAMETLRGMADKQEAEEKEIFYARKRETRIEIEQARSGQSCVIRKGGDMAPPSDQARYLQPGKYVDWGPYETARRFATHARAEARAKELDLKDYGLFP